MMRAARGRASRCWKTLDLLDLLDFHWISLDLFGFIWILLDFQWFSIELRRNHLFYLVKVMFLYKILLNPLIIQ